MRQSRPNTSHDDDSALEPAQMLALLQDQRRTVERRLAASVPYILLAWGVAWLAGFGALWLIDGAEPGFALPLGLAIGIFVALILVAVAVSTVLGIRSSRGVRSTPAAAFTGAAYGMTWTFAFLAIAVFGSGLTANGMSGDLANVFYPAAYAFLVGVLYMVAGAIWRTVPSLVAGAWIVVIAVAAPFFGYPTHYLVFALAGGGAFLVQAVVGFAYVRGPAHPGEYDVSGGTVG